MRLPLFFVAVLFVLAAASSCSSTECDTPRDCVDPLTCQDHKCVKNNNGTIDVDSGVRDQGVRADGGDASADGGDAMTPADGGDAGDAGDAGGPLPLTDGGRIAYDSGTDGGVGEIVTLPSSGLLTYGEFHATTDQTLEVAEIYDRTAASYSMIERRYTDLNGNDCTVTTTRLASGTEVGFVADHLEVIRVGGPRIVRTLSPVAGRPGRFEGTAPFEGFIFTTPGDFNARVVSTHAAGTLDDSMLDLQQPDAAIEGATPTPGTALSLLTNNPMFQFAPTPSLGSVIVEVVDAPREVILHCEIPSQTTTYLIPSDAIQAWYAESPALPAYVEVFYTVLTETQVPIVDSTATIPIRVRSKFGVRYPVQ